MGYDCSLRTCPFGDDPSSYGQVPSVQVLRCLAHGDGTGGAGGAGSSGEGAAAAATGGGAFTLRFRRDGSDVARSAPIAANGTRADVEAALEGLSTIGDVRVDLVNVEGGRSRGDGPVCMPRAANDTLLVLPPPPATGLFADGVTAHGLALALTGAPDRPLTVTLTAVRLDASDGGFGDDASSDVAVWPRNFSFSPAAAGARVGASPQARAFNVTCVRSGRFALRATLVHGAAPYDDDDNLRGGGGDAVPAARFVAFANATEGGSGGGGGGVRASARSWSVQVALRCFDPASAVATPDLGRLNATLLAGATWRNLTVAVSPSALVDLGDDDDDDDDDDAGDDAKNALVVTPTVADALAGLTFSPASLRLTKRLPNGAFSLTRDASATAASGAPPSAAVAWTLSGGLASRFAVPGASGGGGVGDDGLASTVVLGATALVHVPPLLPTVYRSGTSPPLGLRLASPPPAGTALTVTFVAVAVAGGGGQSGGVAFDPPALTFRAAANGEAAPGEGLEGGFRIFGLRTGTYAVSYALAGTAASVYTVSPAGSSGGGAAAASAGAPAWWRLEVAAAPALRVTFLTESGDVPPLRADARRLWGGGAHVEVHAGGSHALAGADLSRLGLSGDDDDDDLPAAARNNAKGSDLATAEALLSVSGTTESAECSDRGACDRTTGVCRCFDGYRSSDGAGKLGVRGDCGFLVPRIEPLWEGNDPPASLVADPSAPQ